MIRLLFGNKVDHYLVDVTNEALRTKKYMDAALKLEGLHDFLMTLEGWDGATIQAINKHILWFRKAAVVPAFAQKMQDAMREAKEKTRG